MSTTTEHSTADEPLQPRPGPKRHVCPDPACGKSFSRPAHLYRHALNHSAAELVCPRCGASFKRLDLLERHKTRHLSKDLLAGGKGLGSLRPWRRRFKHGHSGPGLGPGSSLGPVSTMEQPLTTDQEPSGLPPSGTPVPDPFELGFMYQDSMFDAVHFGITGSEPSPLPNLFRQQPDFYDALVPPEWTDSPHEQLLDSTDRLAIYLDNLALSSEKRNEIMCLVDQIKPVHPDGTLVTEQTADLSLGWMQQNIDAFFAHFNQSYPMIHCPTLEINQTEPILLLSLIIMGATYGGKTSHQLSVCLYDAIIPHILSGLISISFPDLQTLQGFLILECYGMYRAGPYQRENAILVHGLLFHAIRRLSRYHVRARITLPSWLQDMDPGWKGFAYAEQYKRLILFVFLWDTQNVSCYSFMPSMSTQTIQIQLPCPTRVWEATTEQRWAALWPTCAAPPTLSDAVQSILESNTHHAGPPLDNLSLTFVLHGLMSMCNDVVHFDNRSLHLPGVEHDEARLDATPWRRRMADALEAWKVQHDARAMCNLQDLASGPARERLQRDNVALLGLYHIAHILVNADVRHLLIAAGAKAVFGHVVLPADRAESEHIVRLWVRTRPRSAGHAAWHAAQLFREGLLGLKDWDVGGIFHYPWCLFIGVLTCWAFHHFSDRRDKTAMACHSHGTILSEQARTIMNSMVSQMVSSLESIDAESGRHCPHGLAMEIAAHLRGIRWAAAYDAMKILQGLVDLPQVVD